MSGVRPGLVGLAFGGLTKITDEFPPAAYPFLVNVTRQTAVTRVDNATVRPDDESGDAHPPADAGRPRRSVPAGLLEGPPLATDLHATFAITGKEVRAHHRLTCMVYVRRARHR